MRVLGTDKLFKFTQKYSNSRPALKAWLNEAAQAVWNTPQDIKERYNSVDFLTDNKVIFNIKGNHYRLVVQVRYQYNTVIIEWIGTHSDYEKKRF